MESAEIVARITPIVREVFDDESIVVDRQLTAADVDGWDSLNQDRKSTRLNSSHSQQSRMPSSA